MSASSAIRSTAIYFIIGRTTDAIRVPVIATVANSPSRDDIPLISYFQAAATVPAPAFIHHGLRRVAGMLTLKQDHTGDCILGGGWTGISAFPVHGNVSAEALAENRAIASRLVPAFAALEMRHCWAGYDGSSLDGQPILDGVPGYPGLFVSTGASTGFSDGPMLGELGARMLLGLPTSHDLDLLALSRFASAPMV